MPVAIHVPDGYELVTKVSIEYPKETFNFINRVPTYRAKWKFWLPKFVYTYCIVRQKENTN